MIHRIYEHYKNPDEKRINTGIMNGEFEDPIEAYVEECFSSIHDVIETITMTSSEFIVDEDKMMPQQRTRSKDKKNERRRIYNIARSRLGELKMTFHVSDVFKVSEDDPGEPVELDFTVREQIPIPDKFGNLLLRGVNYIPQYQLTETSTYVTSSDLVMKSVTPIKIKKVPLDVRSMDGSFYTIHAFHFRMMEDVVNILIYFFVEFGIQDTIEFFNCGRFIEVLSMDMINKYGRKPDKLYFEGNKYIVVEVDKDAFNKSEYIRTMVGTIYDTIAGKMTYEEYLDKNEWLLRIGATKKTSKKEAHEELGRRYRILYTRMLDKGSQNSLRTTWFNKRSIYNIIRWNCQNYNKLRAKDNLDIRYKKLRRNQYIGQYVNIIISEHIKKLVNTTCSTKDSMYNMYKQFFSFKGTEVINGIHSSGLMKYDSLVNDLNVFQKFKVTMKGPNSLGNKNSRNIAARQRELHPSHIGILGLDTCSASDPGITNYINPLCKTNGLFFDGAPEEPEDAFYNLMVETGVLNGDLTDCIQIVDPVKFNNVLDLIDNITINAPSKD